MEGGDDEGTDGGELETLLVAQRTGVRFRGRSERLQETEVSVDEGRVKRGALKYTKEAER